MSELFNKITRAADAFAEVITENVRADSTVKVYHYEDFKRFVLSKRKKYPQIEKCIISVRVAREFDDMVFSENKYIIRMLMLDEEEKPICINGNAEEYVGGFVIAEGIDKHLNNFMGGKAERTIILGGK